MARPISLWTLPLTVTLLAGPSPAPGDSPPRLLLSPDGAILRTEGKPDRRFATIAELVVALPGFHGEVEVAPAPEPAPAASGRPAPARRATISAGEVPAIELVKLLAELLDSPVVSDGADQALRERVVLVPQRIEAADPALVRRLLEANRLRVLESPLEDGRRLLTIEDAEAPREPGEPRARPIVEVEKAAGSTPRSGAAPPRAARPPPDEVHGYAGVILEDLPEMLRAQVRLELGAGILVADVNETLAARSRTLRLLQRYDIVTQVGATALSHPADFVAALERIAPGAAFELRVLRQGTLKILRGRR